MNFQIYELAPPAKPMAPPAKPMAPPAKPMTFSVCCAMHSRIDRWRLFALGASDQSLLAALRPAGELSSSGCARTPSGDTLEFHRNMSPHRCAHVDARRHPARAWVNPLLVVRASTVPCSGPCSVPCSGPCSGGTLAVRPRVHNDVETCSCVYCVRVSARKERVRSL